jgi:thiamine-phosphate pyrophosphorylase
MPLPKTPLYVICDQDVCAQAGWTLTDYASACLNGGARLLQIRMKNAPGKSFLDEAIAIVERARQAGATIVVNDRADVARLSHAGGVHVGQEDLSPQQVRAVCGDSVVVGLSTHTAEQMAAAAEAPIDYLAIGPVFGTSTKDTGYSAVGLARVAEAVAVASRRQIPVVAIGGITLDRAHSVIAAGATAVAVIGDLLTSGSPEARVREYLERLGGR